MNNRVFKGDNTGAFDNDFLEIELENPNNYTISKAIFVCGKIKKVYENPVFPLKINLDEAETSKLKYSNNCYLVVYDAEGRQETCEGTLTFFGEKGVLDG